MKFANMNDFRKFFCDIYDENLNRKSSSFKLSINCISSLSDNYAWAVYVALHEYLDPQLDSLTIKPTKDYDDNTCPGCKLGIEVCHCGKWPEESN